MLWGKEKGRDKIIRINAALCSSMIVNWAVPDETSKN
jgi:hypothetical protein